MSRDTGDGGRDGRRIGVSRRRYLAGTAAATAGLLGASRSVAAFDGDDGDVVGDPDYPRATTRGHFDIHWWYGDQLTDGHTETDYGTHGELPGDDDTTPDEVVVAVHGWQTAAPDAPDHFATVETSLSNNGYDHPVIGYSWDSDSSLDNWWPATDIAECNGPKLVNFTTDYAAANPGTTIRFTGHSLGARVVLSAIETLNEWGQTDLVESATLLGGAADNDAVSLGGQYGPDVEAAVGHLDNFWKSGDAVLDWAYSTGEFDAAVGEEGCEGTPPANYTDHNVDYVPDHLSYHEPGDGCMPEIVAQF